MAADLPDQSLSGQLPGARLMLAAAVMEGTTKDLGAECAPGTNEALSFGGRSVAAVCQLSPALQSHFPSLSPSQARL